MSQNFRWVIQVLALCAVVGMQPLLGTEYPSPGAGSSSSSGCQNGGETPPCCDCEPTNPACVPEAPSIINPYAGIYIHDAVLYQTPNRLSQGGCAPCGSGGGAIDGLPPNLPSLDLKRFYRSRNGDAKGGSLGKDHFLSTDIVVRLDADATGAISLRVFDPSLASFKHFFQEIRKGNVTDQVDGILYDANSWAVDARLYTAAGVLTNSLAAVATVVITETDRSTRTYEVIDLRAGATSRQARLVRATGRTGVVNQTVNYRFAASASLPTLGNDPARLWEMTTVQAADGTSASFTYDESRLRGWQYGIQSITLPNGSVSCAYVEDSLSVLTLPDGTQATFAVGYDTALQKVKTVISDPGAEPGHQNKTVWWNGDSYTKPDGTVVGEWYGQLRRVDNAVGETILATWPATPTTIYIWQADSGLIRQDTTASSTGLTARSFADNFVLGQDPATATFRQASSYILDPVTAKYPQAVDPLGARTASIYDLATRTRLSSTSPAGGTRTTTRNAFGFPQVETDATGRVTTYTYDAQGNRLTKVVGTGAEAMTWQWRYDARGLMTASIDPNLRQTDYGYDAQGRLITITEPLDGTPGSSLTRAVRRFGYSPVGQLISVTDASNRVTAFAYDARNRVVKRTFGDASTEQVVFGLGSQSGLVAQTIDRNGVITALFYDAAGRAIRTEVASGLPEAQVETCVFAPGSNVRKISCVRDGEQTTYTYDGRFRLSGKAVSPSASVALTSTTVYDAIGRAYRQIDPFGRATTQVYDTDGRNVRTVRELTPGSVDLVAGVNALLAAQPQNFTGVDIGSPTPAGSLAVTGSTWTVAGAGFDLGTTSDQFFYARRSLVGDGVCTVRVVSQTYPDPGAKAGVMLRSSDAPDAAYLCIRVGTSGVQAQYRGASGNPAVVTKNTVTSMPVWLRIVRSGNLSTAQWSSNGVTWNQVAQIVQPLTPQARIGLAVTSHKSGAISTAVFDNLTATFTGGVDSAIQTLTEQQVLLALARPTTGNPAYVIEDQTYDLAGRVLTRTAANGVRADVTYDSLGRVSQEIAAASSALPAATVFGYDPQGGWTSVTSPRGVVTRTTYTGRNLPYQEIEAYGVSGQQTTVSATLYTATRKPQRIADALGRNTTYTYGSCCDRLTAITDPAGFQTAFTYDAVGNRTSVTDGNGLVVITAYDGRNRVATVANQVVVTAPQTETTTYRYDDNLADAVGIGSDPAVLAAITRFNLRSGLVAGVSDGSAVKIINPLGETAYELRDGLGRSRVRIDGLGHASLVSYDTLVGGLVETAQTDALGQLTRARADGAGRVRQQLDALGNISAATYDGNGNQVSLRNANAVGWDAVYDERNRMSSRRDTRTPAGSTAWSYDLDGNRLSETDALGRTESSGYDLRNRRVTLTDRVGGITRFAYDAVSNLTKISDADNEAKGGLGNLPGCTQYGYDVRQLLSAEAFPGGQVGRTLRTYVYDGGRRLTKRTVGILAGAFSATPAYAAAPAVEITGYGYDQANRLTSRTYADGKNDRFAYDHASRLTSAVSARYNDTVGRSYDAAGRLLRESLDVGPIAAYAPLQVSYGYDAADRLTSLTYPDGTTVGRSYSARGELTQLTDQGANVQVRAYDAGGRLTTATDGNATIETRTYVPGSSLVATIRVPGGHRFRVSVRRE